jgi:hypothetical protein
MRHVDQASVAMSPQHLKALVNSLRETLAAYESVYGELKIPEEDTRPQKSAAEIEAVMKGAKKRREEARRAATASSPTEKTHPSRRSRGAAP